MRLSKAVLATLSYSDYFSYPLTVNELHSRLLTKSSLASLKKGLAILLKAQKVAKTDIYYHLPGRSTLVVKRQKRTLLSNSLYLRAHALAARLSRFPGVLAIYLTGSLAVKNTDGHDDIDFMLITQPGRLWTTRLALTLYTSLFHLRRTPSSTKNSGKLCLNLYLTPHSYQLPASKHNLYTAYELIQAVPLYDPYHTHSALLHANKWLAKYLPNFHFSQNKHIPPTIRNSLFIILLESLAYNLQLLYMKPKITHEHITRDSAFFHPHNPGKKVLNRIKL